MRAKYNTWLLNAVWRAHTGQWQIPDEEFLQKKGTYEAEIYWNDLGVLVNTTVRQYARDGELPIWGIRKDETIYEPIPAEYWSNHAFDLFSIMGNRDPKKVKIMQSEQDWHHFKTNKAIIEKIWGLPFGYKSFKTITNFIEACYARNRS